MEIETEIYFVRVQLELLERKIRRGLRRCNRLSESVERAFPSSERSDRTLYRSYHSLLSHSSHENKITKRKAIRKNEDFFILRG